MNSTPKRVRSCTELGVCQMRTPPCSETHINVKHPCSPAFAPGVIEGHKVGIFGTARQRRALWRWVKAAAWWFVFVVVSGVAAGLIVGGQ